MKKIYLFSMIFLLPLVVGAQQFWEKPFPLPSFTSTSTDNYIVKHGLHSDYWTLYTNHFTYPGKHALLHIDSTGQLLGLIEIPKDNNVVSQYWADFIIESNGNFVLLGTINTTDDKDSTQFLKLRPDGTVSQSRHSSNGVTVYDTYTTLVQTAQGGFIAIANSDVPNNKKKFLITAFDSTGNILKFRFLHNTVQDITGDALTAASLTPTGNCVFQFRNYGTAGVNQLIQVFADSEGLVQKSDTISDPYASFFSLTPDLYFTRFKVLQDEVTKRFTLVLTQYDQEGNIIWNKSYLQPAGLGITRDCGFVSNPAGGFSVMIRNDSIVPGPLNGYIRRFYRFSKNGNLVRTMQTYWHSGIPYPQKIAMVANTDGSVFGMGLLTAYQSPFYGYKLFSFHLDPFGFSHPCLVQGKVSMDTNHSCSGDVAEAGLEGCIVRLQKPDAAPYYGRSERDGKFYIEVDTGYYRLDIFPPGAQWKACQSSAMLDLSLPYDTLNLSIPIEPTHASPVIETDAVIERMTLCNDNQIHIHYANRGAQTSDSINVWVALDPALRYQGSEVLPQQIQADTLFFRLPGLLPGASNRFDITAKLACNASVPGRALHVAVWTNEPALSPAWDGADLQVKAACMGDSLVQVTVTNTGSGPTTIPAVLQLIHEDAFWNHPTTLMLAPGGTYTQILPSDGRPWQAKLAEPNGHPWLRYATDGVEGCGGALNPGDLLQFAVNDEAPYLAQEHWPAGKIAGANVIVASPLGYGNDHIISNQDEIEYTIFFRNQSQFESRDVFVLDTVSPWLDLSTLRVTAASFPCQTTLLDHNIIRFGFSQIHLPPELLDPLHSTGYIRFRLRPYADAPADARLINSCYVWLADIWPFGPIQDQVFHTLGEPITTTSVTDPVVRTPALAIFPNPAHEQATVFFPEGDAGENVCTLQDVTGRVIARTVFTGTRFVLSRDMLQDGLYLIEIQNKSGKKATGKIIFNRG